MSSRLRFWRSASSRRALAISGSISASRDMPAVLLALDGGDLLDTPRMAIAGERRLEPDAHDLDRFLVPGDPRAEGKHIGVVVLSCHPCDVGVGAGRRAHTRNL